MHRTFVVVIAVAFLASSLHAEEEREVHEGGEIMVRDQRLRAPEVFRDTAIETEWITEEEIEDIPANDVAEVLEHRAGIRTQQRVQGQEAAVSIEGMPPEYTRILVDGQPWSGEIGGVGDLSDVPLQNIERIELWRGNQGTRFGTDAGGGVINIVTKRAPDAGYRVEAAGLAGTDDKFRGGGTMAYRLGNLGLSLSGDYDQVDGFDPPDDDDVVFAGAGGDESTFKDHFLYGKWDLPLGDTFGLRGNGLWRVEDPDFVPVDGGPAFSRKDTNWRGNLGFDWLALDATSIAADFTYYAVTTESQVGRTFQLDEDEYRGDLRVDHFVETGPLSHSILGGVEVAYQSLDLDEEELTSVDNPDIEGGRDVTESFFTPSVYLQTESVVTDWLSLVLGVRGRFHSEFSSRVLPQVGLLVKPHDSLKLRASWGLNYRTPSLRDLYQPITPQLDNAYFLQGNEDLDPERSMSLRGGFEWAAMVDRSIAGRALAWSPVTDVTLAGTGFFNDIDDHIRSQFAGAVEIGRVVDLIDPEDFSDREVAFCESQQLFTPPEDWTPECTAFFSGMPVERTRIIRRNVFAKANLDSVRTWGAESQLRVRFGKRALLDVDYTWLQNEVADSNVGVDELPNEAEHSFSVRGLFVVPRLDTRLSAAWRWRGRVIPEGSGTGLLSFTDASTTLPPTHQLDFRVTQPLGDFGRVFFDALNVTDQRREDSYAKRGVTFLVGLTLEYEGGVD